MTKSNYITVELYSKQGDLVLRRKVARSGLHFDHCLPLEQGLPSGEYVLIGYTSWMRNFFEIVNSIETYAASIKTFYRKRLNNGT